MRAHCIPYTIKMDDPFGCLQGVKISSKIIQEILQKRNELHLCLLSNRINHCPSCKEQLVYVVNEFCRECPKCCRVFECDDDEQFQEENRGRSSTAPLTTNVHLKNVFRKWNIDKMFSSSQEGIILRIFLSRRRQAHYQFASARILFHSKPRRTLCNL